jgi:hypothetical protein
MGTERITQDRSVSHQLGKLSDGEERCAETAELEPTDAGIFTEKRG